MAACLSRCASFRGILLLVAVRCHAQTDVTFVLQRYTDSACTQLRTDVNSQQSWKRLGDSTFCYDITSGFACEFGCVLRLKCEYGSGSGVLLEFMPQKTCVGMAERSRYMAEDWSWLKANSFFNGQCTPDLDGQTFLRFDRPWGKVNYPNCSIQGSVAAGSDDNPDAFQGHYYLQLYTDNLCTEEHIPTAISMQTASKYQWRVHRGAEFCYDSLDVTPHNPNITARVSKNHLMNYRLLCRNIDQVGNGVMIEQFRERACAGRADAPQTWRTVFTPMNFPALTKLLQGKCVRWKSMYAKFDRSWASSHFPDCGDYACKEGLCAGGRIASGDEWTSYTGPIQTVKGVATVGAAPKLTATWLVPVVAGMQIAQLRMEL